jgi:hypothetical protein
MIRTARAGLLLLLAAVAVTALLSSYRNWNRQWQREKLDRQIAGVAKPDPRLPYPKHFFQRGVSFIRDGRDAYHPEPTRKFLAELKTYGVDSIAVVPYGYFRQSESEVQLGREGGDGALYIALAQVAHSQDIRVLLKPQLWVMPGGYPGVIRITDASERTVWLQSYRRFILHWARIAADAHADLFTIGTELENFSGEAAYWRGLIAEVRKVYPGPLVYAANQGPDFAQVTWWDALDYIGLNEYYPLDSRLDFTPVLERLEKAHRQYQRPVILTEAGFASVAGAEKEPWAEPDRPVDLEHQSRCYEALMQAFWNKPWFHGVYWWKIGADGRGGPGDNSLTPWRKPAMETMARYYRSKSR